MTVRREPPGNDSRGTEGVTGREESIGKLSGKRILIRRSSGEPVSKMTGTEGLNLSGKRTEGTWKSFSIFLCALFCFGNREDAVQ